MAYAETEKEILDGHLSPSRQVTHWIDLDALNTSIDDLLNIIDFSAPNSPSLSDSFLLTLRADASRVDGSVIAKLVEAQGRIYLSFFVDW